MSFQKLLKSEDIMFCVQKFLGPYGIPYWMNGAYCYLAGSIGGEIVEIEGPPYGDKKLRKALKTKWQEQFESVPSEKLIDLVLEILDAIYKHERENGFWREMYAAFANKKPSHLGKTGPDAEKERLVLLAGDIVPYIDGRGDVCFEPPHDWKIPSKNFSRWLRKKYIEVYNDMPSEDGLIDAQRIIMEICQDNPEGCFWDIKVKWAIKKLRNQLS